MVSSDGTFSGVPAHCDSGKTITFTVKVTDADGSDTADYCLEVLGEEMVWIDRFDYLPDIRSLRVDPTLKLNAESPRNVYFPGVKTRNTKYKRSDLFINHSASGFKFGTGSPKSFCILLDKHRFDGKPGDYRFRFKQYGMGKYANVFVSVYGVEFGNSPDSAVNGAKFYCCTLGLSSCEPALAFDGSSFLFPFEPFFSVDSLESPELSISCPCGVTIFNSSCV